MSQKTGHSTAQCRQASLGMGGEFDMRQSQPHLQVGPIPHHTATLWAQYYWSANAKLSMAMSGFWLTAGCSLDTTTHVNLRTCRSIKMEVFVSSIQAVHRMAWKKIRCFLDSAIVKKHHQDGHYQQPCYIIIQALNS